ncbi:MAG TPA: hypothetical protein VMP00_06110 [Burkholderiales bacterium]|nr:hypothetical protein [Burkholderiales bacterium]
MTRFRISVIALAIGLAFNVGTMAQSMSKDQYRSAQDRIAANYALARAACELFSGYANDLCMTEADGDERVARAKLDARYRPSARADYEVRVARAEGRYAVAIEKCTAGADSLEDDCLRAALAAVIAARADAQMQSVRASD